MRFKASQKAIGIGDRVLVEKNVPGVVVCDFDNWQSLKGYESWLTKEKLLGGGTLKSGVMVETKELGFLHYAEEDDNLVADTCSS
jgi:hypothetical protein